MRAYVFPEEILMWKRIAVVGVLAGIVISLGAVLASGILSDRPEDQALQGINQELGIIRDQVESLGAQAAARVTITCYNSEAAQTDSTPHTTAVMTKCRPGVVAVSRDLLEQGWTFGRQVWIEGHGVYTIEDVMAKKKARQIGIWQPDKKRRYRQDNVLAVVLK